MIMIQNSKLNSNNKLSAQVVQWYLMVAQQSLDKELQQTRISYAIMHTKKGNNMDK